MNGFLVFAIALAWLAILVGGWLGWQLLQQNGRLLLRLEEIEKRLDEAELGEPDAPTGLAVGSVAPEFELPALAGETRKLAQYRGKQLLLIFFNPDCSFCRELLPKIMEKIQHAGEAGNPSLLVISTGSTDANRQMFGEHQLSCAVLLEKEMEVATAYTANGTPSGYLISGEGRIASELAVGADALLELMDGNSGHRQPAVNPGAVDSPTGNGNDLADRFSRHSVVRSKIKRDGLKAGTSAPDFSLPRLDGEGELSLAELRDQQVLLVFSSPSCGPCLALAPQLEKFYREHPEIKMVMVSKGDPKENRAKVKEFGLTFPIVLQQQWEISRRYGMFATPIAYLINEQGVIARDVAVGVDGIQALLRQREDHWEHERQVIQPA